LLQVFNAFHGLRLVYSWLGSSLVPLPWGDLRGGRIHFMLRAEGLLVLYGLRSPRFDVSISPDIGG